MVVIIWLPHLQICGPFLASSFVSVYDKYVLKLQCPPLTGYANGINWEAIRFADRPLFPTTFYLPVIGTCPRGRPPGLPGTFVGDHKGVG